MHTLCYTNSLKTGKTQYLCMWERVGQWDRWDKRMDGALDLLTTAILIRLDFLYSIG